MGRLGYALLVVPVLMTGTTRAEETTTFARVCALVETQAITMIEDHGSNKAVPADTLSKAGFTLLHARSTCYEGRVDDALALYDSILALGPVALAQRQ